MVPVVAVRLVPMTEAEREAALEDHVVEYANAKAQAGIWTRAEALYRSRAEIRGLVGGHPSERGHEFFVGLDESGRRVGWIWFGPVPAPGASPDARWLFNIVVEPERRGQGYGRALLRAAEEQVLAEGRSELVLNVFQWNRVAVALYTSSGYAVSFQDPRALEMRKSLRASER